MGASTWAVLSRYLFLNVIQSVPVLFTLNAADATLGGLGFLGLGLPEVAEWGHDLSSSRGAAYRHFGQPWFSDDVNGWAGATGEGLNEFVNPLAARQWNQKSPKPTDLGHLAFNASSAVP